MNEQLTRRTHETYSAVQGTRIPENMRALAEETVMMTSQGYTNMNLIAKHGAKALEEVMLAANANARAIADKVFEYSVANAEMAFDIGKALARAKTIPDMFSLQARFLQQQFATCSEQMKDLFELSTKSARETFDSLNAAGAKSVEQFKKLC
jgi:phasin